MTRRVGGDVLGSLIARVSWRDDWVGCGSGACCWDEEGCIISRIDVAMDELLEYRKNRMIVVAIETVVMLRIFMYKISGGD